MVMLQSYSHCALLCKFYIHLTSDIFTYSVFLQSWKTDLNIMSEGEACYSKFGGIQNSNLKTKNTPPTMWTLISLNQTNKLQGIFITQIFPCFFLSLPFQRETLTINPEFALLIPEEILITEVRKQHLQLVLSFPHM